MDRTLTQAQINPTRLVSQTNNASIFLFNQFLRNINGDRFFFNLSTDRINQMILQPIFLTVRYVLGLALEKVACFVCLHIR